MEISVKPMEEADVEGTVSMMKEAWQYAHDTWCQGTYPEEAHEFDMSKQTPENYRKLLGNEFAFCFIAIADGRFAGKISGEIFGNSGYTMIRSLAVHPDFHRNGVGRAMMERTLEYLREKKIHKVSLNTLPCLIPAINLYLKMGFVPEAYLARQWWGMDFIYMSKWLGD